MILFLHSYTETLFPKLQTYMGVQCIHDGMLKCIKHTCIKTCTHVAHRSATTVQQNTTKSTDHFAHQISITKSSPQFSEFAKLFEDFGEFLVVTRLTELHLHGFCTVVSHCEVRQLGKTAKRIVYLTHMHI